MSRLAPVLRQAAAAAPLRLRFAVSDLPHMRHAFERCLQLWIAAGRPRRYAIGELEQHQPLFMKPLWQERWALVRGALLWMAQRNVVELTLDCIEFIVKGGTDVFIIPFNDRPTVEWISGCCSQGLSHWQLEVLEGGDSAMAFQTAGLPNLFWPYFRLLN